MNSVERTVIAATRAYGEIVRGIRPLELTPGQAPAGSAATAPASGAPRAPGPRGRAPRAPQARRPRRLRSWLAPAAAAAAVLAIGVTLAIVRDIPGGRGAPPPAPASAASIPPYYVALTGTGWYAYAPLSGTSSLPTAAIVVGATFTGRQLATVAAPRGTTFTGATAAADDRTFVVGTAKPSPASDGAAAAFDASQAWYLLRIFPGSSPAYRLTRLPIPATQAGTAVEARALSADGTELALALQPGAGTGKPGREQLLVYSVATGAVLRTWTGPADGIVGGSPGLSGDTYGTLSWADGGHELAFNYRWTTGPQAGPKGTPNRDKLLRQDRDHHQVRVLDLSRPGHDLLADSQVIWSVSEPVYSTAPASPLTCDTDLLLTPDGSTLACGATGTLRDPGTMHPGPDGCPAIQPWNDLAFLGYSAATGRLAGVTGKWETSCLPGTQPIALLWAGPSGSPLLGYMAGRQAADGSPRSDIGVYSATGYRPLPNLPLGATAFSTAW